MQQTPITEALIRTVVTEFYAKARKDALLGPVSRRVVPDEHWAAHIATITDFWSSVFLKTGRYQGRPMPEHLTIPEISDDHFRRWLTLFGETAEEECRPKQPHCSRNGPRRSPMRCGSILPCRGARIWWA